MQRRHSVGAKPLGLLKPAHPPANAGNVRGKVEHEDIKPIIKREHSAIPKAQRARSLSRAPDAAKRFNHSGNKAIQQLLGRSRRSSVRSATNGPQSARRGTSVLSTTSSMTSSGLRFDRPPSQGARDGTIPNQDSIADSSEDEDSDDVMEVSDPAKAKPKVAPASTANNSDDYVNFTLRLEAPSVFPWPQTVSFTAPRLKDWTVAGLQNQRQLKRCSRTLQENILNLHQTQ